MAAALTSGGLRDIINLYTLAIELGRAVGVGRGSAGESVKEYQQIRGELDTFTQILVQVITTYKQHECSPYLEEIDKILKTVVDECTSLITDTLDDFQSQYGNSLSIGGSGEKRKDIPRRIKWSMREEENLPILRTKLQYGVQRLSLITSLAAEKSAQANNVTVLARLDRAQQLMSELYTGQEELHESLQEHRKAGQQQEEMLSLNLQHLQNLIVHVSKDIINLQIAASDSLCLRRLDPTKELPATVEDALGRQLEIPAQWIDIIEWEVLNSLLKGRFKGQKGHEKVSRHEYALEDSASGRDLRPEVPLYYCLRRGMKVNMSMIFHADTVVVGACPRCRTETDAPENTTIQCNISTCGMWFRMQKQVVEVSAPDPVTRLEGSGPTQPVDGTKIVTSIPVEPGDFQRVRLLSLVRVRASRRLSTTQEKAGDWTHPGTLSRIDDTLSRIDGWNDPESLTWINGWTNPGTYARIGGLANPSTLERTGGWSDFNTPANSGDWLDLNVIPSSASKAFSIEPPDYRIYYTKAIQFRLQDRFSIPTREGGVVGYGIDMDPDTEHDIYYQASYL